VENKQNSAEQKATASVTTLLKEFAVRIREGTSCAEAFMTLDEIEGQWIELRHNTERIYSDMMEEIIASIDEKGLIRKKKECGQNVE